MTEPTANELRDLAAKCITEMVTYRALNLRLKAEAVEADGKRNSAYNLYWQLYHTLEKVGESCPLLPKSFGGEAEEPFIA